MSEVFLQSRVVLQSVLVPPLNLEVHHGIEDVEKCLKKFATSKSSLILRIMVPKKAAAQAVHHLCCDIPVQHAMQHPLNASPG